MKTNWMLLRQAHGWIGGNESILFLTSKLKSKSWCQRKWRSSQKSARTQDAKRIGNEAINCAIESPRSAGKCATRKMVRSSRDTAQRALGSARVSRALPRKMRSQRPGRFVILSLKMFAPADFLDLEHTAHLQLFENQTHLGDAPHHLAS